jgi:hypothetical protein
MFEKQSENLVLLGIALILALMVYVILYHPEWLVWILRGGA